MRRISGVDYLTTIEELVDPEQTAVVVIDMQNDNVSEEGVYARAGTDVSPVSAIVPRIQRLLSAAREIGVLVAYAEYVMRGKLGGNLVAPSSLYQYREDNVVPEMIQATWGVQTIDELAPQAGDVIIHKNRGTAMHGSILADILRMRGIRSLALTGVFTNGSVMDTAMDTAQHGYYAVIIRDCVGSLTAKNHQLAMSWMETRFPVFDLDEVLAMWQRKAWLFPGGSVSPLGKGRLGHEQRKGGVANSSKR